MRIFVGGLPPDITAADVAARFAPFGTVTACDIAPEKQAGTATATSKAKRPPPPPPCRGFAHITFEPRDAAALARCLSLVRCFCCRDMLGGLRVIHSIAAS
jgi:RNA recognition motif-containing protein